MFHYFYLISLLLCINLVFSYEYLDDAPGKTFHSFGKNVKRVGMLGKRKERKNVIRQEYSYDKNPVEFDVAGFIQPDEETVADEEAIKHRNQLRRRRISKNNDYNSLFGLNMEEGTNNKGVNEDYLNFGDSQVNLSPTLMNLSPPLLKDAMNIKKFKMSNAEDQNSKYSNDNLKNLLKNQIVLPEQNPAHNPQKKCILKSLKLPFLSRSNKTEPSKPRKAKKRKLFCFKCPKKTPQENSNQNGVLVDVIKEKKSKRSYDERLCPACRRKFITFTSDDEGKNPSTKDMHNRLISENYMDAAAVKEPYKKSSNKLIRFNSEDYREAVEKFQRNKRQEPGILMRRELDMIQQMIEHEDAHTSNNIKSTPTNTQE